MLPTQVVRHEAECVKPFLRQPGFRECPGTSPASPDLWTGLSRSEDKDSKMCLTVHWKKEKFDKEMQPFSLERLILIIVNVYLDFVLIFQVTLLTKTRNI